MGNKKKDETDVVADEEANSNEGRPEGTDAEVFAQPVDNVGFNPRRPQPPSYIKVRSKHKKEREFDHLFLAQELECRKRRKIERQNSSNKLRRKSSSPIEADTVWAMEFSKDGKYLAAAGADGVVRVWAVLASSEDRQKHEKQEALENEAKGVEAHSEHLSAPVFQRQPIREFEGHTSTILDLSWSKNNFLLSSSMDKTVRLWHVSRTECLCTFKHADFVPSIAFHPKDDRFFLAGSLDSRLRLWSIPDKSVAYTARLHDMVTAVAFTPDGKCAIAGCLSGVCMFYETEGLKYQSQVHVRSARGQNAKGSKITGIHAHQNFRGDAKLLITSNDSRVRLYNFRDKNLELKFRGNENNSSQIRATMSDDGRYVICGSEDRKAYIWSMGPAEGDRRDRRPLEMFEANDTITTVVCFAPAKTRHLLGKSEDPVYDLCNPPPITLMSRAERAECQSSSRPPTDAGSIQSTPAEVEGKFERPKESASYLARSSQKNGNIIVTADFKGRIKVFRQDCAWAKRKLDDDRSSIFSKRAGRLSRNGSVMTRGSQPSLREGRTSLSTSGPSDRILSWRQGIASSPSVNDTQRRESKNTDRSISPRMSIEQRAPRDRNASDARKTSNGSWAGWAARVRSNTPTTATTSSNIHIDTAKARAAADDTNTGKGSSGSNSPRSVRDDNPLMLSGGRS
jgi:WD40 repeat protein